MSIKLQLFLIVGTLFTVYFMFRLVRKGTLQLKYSLLWIFIAIIMVILTIFPVILDVISNFLGIVTPTNILFLLGMLFELMIVFSLTVSLSRSSERVKILSQEIALLRKELEDNFKN